MDKERLIQLTSVIKGNTLALKAMVPAMFQSVINEILVNTVKLEQEIYKGAASEAPAQPKD